MSTEQGYQEGYEAGYATGWTEALASLETDEEAAVRDTNVMEQHI